MRLVTLAACIAGALALAVAGYTGYWFVAAGEIENRLDAWAEEQRARGVDVEFAEVDVGGYPFRFEVSLREPRIRDTTKGWRWAAAALRAEALAWDFSEIAVLPDRRNEVGLLLPGGDWREIETRIDDGRLAVRLDETRRLREIALDLRGVQVEGLWSQGPASVGSLQATGLALDDDGNGEEALKTSLAVRDILLPSGLGQELGETLAFLDIDASVVGPIPSGQGTSEAIAAWREAGGTLELTGFRVRWGPLGIESSGTIALDGAMRPIAALTADIIGYGDAIDALIMSNVIPIGDAFIAKVAFNMLAEKPEDGGPRVLRAVPITAQDGALSVGPVKVAELSPLPLN